VISIGVPGRRSSTHLRTVADLTGRFEAGFGTTNRGNIRLELNACCAESQTVAVGIAAS
jgi:hypothetical protein